MVEDEKKAQPRVGRIIEVEKRGKQVTTLNTGFQTEKRPDKGPRGDETRF